MKSLLETYKSNKDQVFSDYELERANRLNIPRLIKEAKEDMLQMTKTEQMLEQAADALLSADRHLHLSCPVDNQYQGNARRMLFVCTAGLLRSPTGANVATKLGFNARSCGSSVRMALIPISVNLVYWAKHIFFLNSGNFDESRIALAYDSSACDLMRRKAIILDIEDDFNYMDYGLVEQFKLILNQTKFVD